MQRKYPLFQLASKKTIIFIAVIILVVLASVFPTFSFYFWHDDFSVLYGPRTGTCIFDWPYKQYCPIFNTLIIVFGYKPSYYFFTGVVLACFTAVSFYVFMLQLFEKKTALIVTLMYSTFYVGAGVFFESYDPIISFLPLSSLFIALILLHSKRFLWGLAMFGISVLSFSARSSTSFIPIISLLLILTNLSFWKKCILSCIVMLVFLVSFNLPFGVLTPQKVDLISKTEKFLQMSGSWILTDEIQAYWSPNYNLQKINQFRLILASVLYSVFFYLTFKNFVQSKQTYRLQIFAIIWILSMYLPYGLRTDWRLETTHRYLVFVFPGVLIAWATLAKYRFWIPISISFLIFSIFQSNSFLMIHAKESIDRKNFYSQLHQLLPSMSNHKILFFDAPPKFKNKLTDFMRVGYTPPESALGTEYTANYHDIRVVLESDVLIRDMESKKIKIDNLTSFFYDGQNLFDTSKKDYPFAIPSKIRFRLRARIDPQRIKIEEGCKDCGYSSQDLLSAYKYIIARRSIKNKVSVMLSSIGEESSPDSIIDSDVSTFWIGNRQEWLKNNSINVDFKFSSPVNLEGFTLVSSSLGHIPTGLQNSFKEVITDKLLLIITDTDGNDVPVINEIEFVPAGFKDVNLNLVQKILVDSKQVVRNEIEKTGLINYLNLGVKGCLEWESGSYGIGKKDILIMADDKIHEYSLTIPALGIDTPKFKISCINYPVDIDQPLFTSKMK